MQKRKRILIKVCAALSAISGIVILTWVFLPIISYQLKSSGVQTFLSPVPANANDYTKASSFFPGAKLAADYSKPSISSYKISIPRLKIRNATVAIGGEDLAESLIQYPGTALPGKIGNAAIFGHSVLPVFYNPEDYLTIFSLLPTLGKGDIITVTYDGITYKYQVEEKFEVTPDDIQVLDQDESDSFLSLITCVPPGLQTNRLIVKARIVPVRTN